MVTDRAFGQLKSRWRILYRKSECEPESVKLAALASIVLHNICIHEDDNLPPQLDLTSNYPSRQRNREKIRKLLKMKNCLPKKDPSKVAEVIRTALAQKLWKEKEGHGVQ